MIMTVWKDATEASIKWPPAKPSTVEDLLDEAHDMFYGLIQILEAERKASA
jgi:hypothetical protein